VDLFLQVFLELPVHLDYLNLEYLVYLVDLEYLLALLLRQNLEFLDLQIYRLDLEFLGHLENQHLEIPEFLADPVIPEYRIHQFFLEILDFLVLLRNLDLPEFQGILENQ
jgi:hypothetical protein